LNQCGLGVTIHTCPIAILNFFQRHGKVCVIDSCHELECNFVVVECKARMSLHETWAGYVLEEGFFAVNDELRKGTPWLRQNVVRWCTREL